MYSILETCQAVKRFRIFFVCSEYVFFVVVMNSINIMLFNDIIIKYSYLCMFPLLDFLYEKVWEQSNLSRFSLQSVHS